MWTVCRLCTRQRVGTSITLYWATFLGCVHPVSHDTYKQDIRRFQLPSIADIKSVLNVDYRQPIQGYVFIVPSGTRRRGSLAFNNAKQLLASTALWFPDTTSQANHRAIRSDFVSVSNMYATTGFDPLPARHAAQAAVFTATRLSRRTECSRQILFAGAQDCARPIAVLQMLVAACVQSQRGI